MQSNMPALKWNSRRSEDYSESGHGASPATPAASNPPPSGPPKKALIASRMEWVVPTQEITRSGHRPQM